VFCRFALLIFAIIASNTAVHSTDPDETKDFTNRTQQDKNLSMEQVISLEALDPDSSTPWHQEYPTKSGK
jgi:hypothetical protein